MTAKMLPEAFGGERGPEWRRQVAGLGWYTATANPDTPDERDLASSFDREFVEQVAAWAEHHGATTNRPDDRRLL